jgi:hypothetical protein
VVHAVASPSECSQQVSANKNFAFNLSSIRDVNNHMIGLDFFNGGTFLLQRGVSDR